MTGEVVFGILIGSSLISGLISLTMPLRRFGASLAKNQGQMAKGSNVRALTVDSFCMFSVFSVL